MTTPIPNRAIPRGAYATLAERLRVEDEELDTIETPRQRASREADEETQRRERDALECPEEQ